jgi:transposase
MSNFKTYNQKQGMFCSLIPDELLESDHPARIVDAVVEKLNLEKIYSYYSEEGNEAFHPKMMIKVLFYGYQQGIFSGRKLESSLKVRADFIFLSGGQVPDFRTLNLFRIRHKDTLPEIFAQIVFLCKRLGMIDFKNLAVDGQKIAANASFKVNYNRKRLEKAYNKIKTGFSKLLEKEINEDFTEDLKTSRVSRLKEKMDDLEKMQRELEAIGDENASLNQTDKDAKIMTHKDRKIVPSYNHQSAVDEKYGVTTAVQTTQSVDKPEDLFSVVDQSVEITGENHENVLADCGFASYESLEKMETEKAENYHVPDRLFESAKKNSAADNKIGIEDFIKDEQGNYHCPNGKMMKVRHVKDFDDGHRVTTYECKECESCAIKDRCTKGKSRTITVDSREPYREIMRERLKSDKGRETYMKRQWLSENGHGNDQKNLGWKQHSLRGLDKASLEFLLIRIGSNLSKIIKYRAKEMLALV